MIPTNLLGTLPSGLRDPLIATLSKICRNYAERRWEPSELNGGKLCEIVYTIVDGTISGTYAAQPSKPGNFVQACRALEGHPTDPSRQGDRSLRILIPRTLVAVYEIRNNRGVGHVGGDVDPNYMDATFVHSSAKWVVAELVRIFHQVSTADAQLAVDSLIERKLPVVWEKEGIKRILVPELSYADQVLLLLYCDTSWVDVADLLTWTEYSNASTFRKKLLTDKHKARLVEFNKAKDVACLTTAGVADVEDRLLPSLDATI